MRTPPLGKRAAMLGAMVAAAFLVTCGDRGPDRETTAEEAPTTTEPASAAAPAAGAPCPQPPPCGDDCSNHPFTPTDCWTTQYGPAKADVIVSDRVGGALTSPNMLYCDGGSYALCFFSGPPDPTGKKRDDNDPLPCVLEADVANCTCQVYTSGPYFVDINAILNLGAYYETVEACGQDGSGCANIQNCGQDGKKPRCQERTRAPVCQYVKNQNPADPAVSLMPKADLVSTFSFAMKDGYQIGNTGPCNGVYAGCMTAPCFFKEGAEQPPSDGDPIQCECPTYDGDFQVGQNDQDCTIGDGTTYVWSAANTVSPD